MSRLYGVLAQLFVLALLGLSTAVSAERPLTLRREYVPPYAGANQHWQIARALHETKLQNKDALRSSMTISRTWDGAVLLKVGVSQKSKNAPNVVLAESVQIVCTRCYVRGLVKSELVVPDNVNITGVATQTISAVDTTVRDIVRTFVGSIGDFLESLWQGIEHGSLNNVQFPTINTSFALQLPPPPPVTLNFVFDGLDVYMELDTTLDGKATYTQNLFTSQSIIGIGLGEKQTLGITGFVDLILSVDAAIDMRSGFHVRFEDGLGISMALFNDTINKLTNNGGKFEMLPVTVESAGVTLNAILRIGVHAGITFAAETHGLPITVANHSLSADLKSGIEARVYANAIDLTAGVALAREDLKCSMKVLGGYQMAVGAAAGASIAIGEHTWGPVPSTQTVVWKATGSLCASQLPTTTASIRTNYKRDNMVTSTTVATRIYTAVQCLSTVPGGFCPASMQTSSLTSQKITYSTTVSSGARITWPATPGIIDAVTSTVPFGIEVFKMTSTSGSPAPYTAAPTSSVNDVLGSAWDHLNKQLVFGLAFGLGFPIFIITVTMCVVCTKRRRRNKGIEYAPVALTADTLIDVKKAITRKPVAKTASVVQVQEFRD